MKKVLAALVALCGALCACAAGFDGKNLVTNDWFDASFISCAVDTQITTNTSTGITRGAGMWTEAPTNGTATIVADADAGGGATCLSLNAPGELLKFTPAPFSVTSGMETVVAEFKADAIDSLPDLPETAQGGFTVYMDANDVLSAKGWTSTGWTTLSSAPVDSLTNQWVTVYLDFATVNNVRYVRYSVKPATGSLSILTDEGGNSWFQARTNATTVSAVAFSGVATCRTFSGDSLEEVMVAEVNGVQYPSVSAAVAAANAGDTVTLVKPIAEGTLTISKNVTLDFNGKAAILDGIVINEDKTLTVTKANASGNVIPTITGGGNLVVSGNNTFNWKGMAGTSTLASITQEGTSGGISIFGNGTINVTGAVTVGATLTFTPDAATSDIISAHPYYTIKLSAASVTAATLNGGATIETTDGVTASAGTFYGTVAGTGGLTANGDFTIQGPSTYSGPLSIAAGKTYAIGRYDYDSLVAYNFDASSTTGWSFVQDENDEDTTSISIMTTAIGSKWSFKSVGAAYATLEAKEGFFDGLNAIHMVQGNQYQYNASSIKGYRSWTSIAVHQRLALPDSSHSKLKDGYDYIGEYLHYYSYTKRKSGVYNFDGLLLDNNGKWQAHVGSTDLSSYIYTDGEHKQTYKAGEKSIVSLNHEYTTNGNRYDNIGCGNNKDSDTTGDLEHLYGYVGAVAEIIGFNTVLPLEKRAAVETYLMHKWNLTNKGNLVYIPSSAAISLAAGATLDLGGLSQTVKSIAVSSDGTATVQNGTLTVTDAISVGVGETLVIPYGSTYTLANDGTFADVDSDAGTVTITHYAAAIDGTPYATVREAILAYISGTLTIYDSATDIDLGTADVNITGVVLASGVSAPTFAANLQYTASYSSGTISNVRDAKTYVWNGGVDTAWSTLGNWQIGDDEPLLVPAAGDTISFTSAATVTTVPASTSVSAITMGSTIGTVTITGEPLTNSTAISVGVGNTLVIPYGSVYTLADGTGEMVDTTAGTVTLKHKAATITADDVTTVYDTVQSAVAAYESGILTVHESAVIDFGTTEVNVTNAVLDTGVVLTFTQNAPWMTEYDRDAGTIVNTRVASTYVWTPGENETAWAALSNWRIGAATPVALPGTSDTVLFPGSEEQEFTGWTVALAADVYATNLVVNGDMKFSGGLIHTGNVGGNGTITLNGNAGFHTYDWEQTNLQVTNNLVIVGTGNKFQTKGSNSYMNGGSIDVYGSVTGDGEITTIGKRSRVRFHGDWTEFSGIVNAQDDGVPRHALRLMAAQASSSNAVWNVWMTTENNGDSAFLDTSTTSYSDADTYHYYFGALNGRITLYQKYNNTLEIGALNQDCAFSGSIAATHRNHIKKVGSATLTFSGSGLGRLEVAGGVFASGNNSAIPNERITFSGEGGFFDPTTNTVDFAAKLVNSTEAPIGLYVTNNLAIGEIPDSNTGGLVKKGEGTLTLTAAPLYTGDTYLDGGTLKIPTSASVTVKTHVEGRSVRVRKSDDSNYRVYTLGPKVGPMVILF